MHKLLQRQLKRYAHVDSLDTVPQPWRTLLSAVSAAYDEADDDRKLVERSLEISSQELLQANAEMRAVSEELARSNADLEQFAYVASHDLREPLRMIASYLQLLERRYSDRLDDNANEYISFAVDGAKRMQKLIDGLLAFSRAGRHGQPFAAIDLNPLLDHVCHDLQFAIADAQATIHRGPLPIIQCDPVQIGQVFQNLIGNALKFRNSHPVEIDISASAKSRIWRFEVKDNGIGFEAEQSQRIFALFQRLHPQSEYPGTGLGLAICKKIIERHGGEIGAHSTPGQGTCFFFTIPMPVSDFSTDRLTELPASEL